MSDSPPAPDDTPAAGSSAAAHAFRAQAVLAGTGIDLGALGAAERPGGAPLVVELIGALDGLGIAGSPAGGLGAGRATTGVAVLFRYGAVVFFGVSPAGVSEYLRQIGPHLRQPLGTADRETEGLEIRAGGARFAWSSRVNSKPTGS
jgi:hypothetical protein